MVGAQVAGLLASRGEGLGSGRDPAEISSLFARDLVYKVQGDHEVLLWIAHETGRQAIVEMVRNILALTEPVTLEVVLGI